MRTESGTVKLRLVVEDDLTLNGMAVKGVTVESGALLILNGTVVGDLLVQRDAKAEVNGTVHGELVNQGGTVNLRGVVHGRVNTISGETNIDQNAVVTEP
jgi:hypothetical protein